MRKASVRDEQAKRVMADMHLHAYQRDYEIHHIYGRIGRLKACQRFMAMLSQEQHHGAMGIAVQARLRKENRQEYLAFRHANLYDRDVTICRWAKCSRREECPLWKRGLEEDAK